MNTNTLLRLADKVTAVSLSSKVTLLRGDGAKWAVRRIDGPAYFLHKGKWLIASGENFTIPFSFTFDNAVAAGEEYLDGLALGEAPSKKRHPMRVGMHR